MFVYLIIVVYLIGCVYATWQLAWWLKRTRWGHKHKLHWYAIALGFISLIPLAAAFLPESRFDAYLQRFSNVWLGLLAAFAVQLIIWHVVKHFIHMVSTRQAELIMGITLGLTLLFNLTGFIHAQQIYTHYYAVKVSAESTELVSEALYNNDSSKFSEADIVKPEGATRVAFLSDMHMGVNTLYSTIEETVNCVNDAEPDCIIGGGDYFTSSYVGLFTADKYADLLATMTDEDTSAYMAYGNHDVTEPLFCGFAIKDPHKVYRNDDMNRFFKRCKWNMLSDECIELNGIKLYFRQDASKTGDGKNKRCDCKDISSSVDETKPFIVVEHEPDEFNELANMGAELVLSGHTHDGQVWPGTWITRLASKNAHGYKAARDISSLEKSARNMNMATITSSGSGYFGPPLRIGCHSEVVIIDLIQ